MAEVKRPSLQPFRVTFQRSPPLRLRTQITVKTLDPASVLPPRPMLRYRSEPHTRRPKIVQKQSNKHCDESLVIQSSQPTLVQIAQVLTARDRATRSPGVLEKYNRHVHLPLVKPDSHPQHTEISFRAMSDEERSEDSNEQDVDLGKFIRSKAAVNVREIKVDAVFCRENDGQLSPLTSVNKAFELRAQSPYKHLRTSLNSIRRSTPKPSSRSSEKTLALKFALPYRLSIEQNARNRIRWIQKHKSGLRRLVDN